MVPAAPWQPHVVQRMQAAAAKAQRTIILTDPDKAGGQARTQLLAHLPQALHAFVSAGRRHLLSGLQVAPASALAQLQSARCLHARPGSGCALHLCSCSSRLTGNDTQHSLRSALPGLLPSLAAGVQAA